MSEPKNFTTPTGRLVAGSLYKGSSTNADGAPLVVKSGPNIGQPRLDYFFALAIKKTPGQHWAAEPWGAAIWEVGHKFQPSAGQNPKFAWKVQDGDSTVPNAKNKRNCDRMGYPGHWILAFSSGFAPKIYTLVNSAEPTVFAQPDAVNLGDYVQVNCTVADNGSTQQPGVYLNHNMVCLIGYGERIVVGPDVSQAGFGGPLPPGATTAPQGNFAPPPPAPGAPVLQGAPVAPPPPAAPAPLAVVPNPALVHAVVGAPPAAPVLQGAPVAPTPPAPPAPPPAAAGPVMLPAANGYSYNDLLALGWTDETLRAQNMMV